MNSNYTTGQVRKCLLLNLKYIFNTGRKYQSNQCVKISGLSSFHQNLIGIFLIVYYIQCIKIQGSYFTTGTVNIFRAF